MSAAPAAGCRAPPAAPAGRAVAWGVTWLSYATYYLGRKGISVAKAPMGAELGGRVLYGVDTAFLAAYAAGQFASGLLGDRFGARWLVGLGMLASAAACAVFGAGSAAALFVAAFVVNGLAQSTGWPGNVKAMAEWTTPANRGAVMGIWATCYQVGGIAATALATRALVLYGWRGAFFVPAVGLAAVGILVLLSLRPGPGAAPAARSASAKRGGGGGGEGAAAEPAQSAEQRRAARNAVLRSPLVWWYGGSYFCIKLIRYSLLFWLPFYLTTALGYSAADAGYLSISFEVGGVLGTIGIGFASDAFRRFSRSAFAAVSLVGLAAALLLYSEVAALGQLENFAAMALVGALLFAPDSLISGAAAQDAGGPRAAAIAAGVINGIGSLGAIAQEAVTRGVSHAFGWSALFYVFLGLALLSAACLVPTLRSRPSGQRERAAVA